MTSTNNQCIKALNVLVTAAVDSAYGYRSAANDTRNPRFKSLFRKRAAERNRLAMDLRTEIRGLGGKQQDESANRESAQPMLCSLKQTAARRDQVVVSKVEAEEGHMESSFEQALKGHCLSDSVMGTVGSAFIVIKADHDQMRGWKRRLRG